jgi:hypothetical protein
VTQARSQTTAPADETGPEEGRLCAQTRVEKCPDDLIRFVAGPDRTIVPDLARKLPGRGVWISCDKATVMAAARSGAFAKSLKKQVNVSADLADLVEKLMVDRCRAGLSLAKKGGLVSNGYQKVEAAVAAGHVAVLVQALDGADDGIDRLARKFIALSTHSGRTADIVREMTSAELGLAIGRANVIHAALAEGGQTRRFLADCIRLRQYRHGSGALRQPECG